MEGAALAAREQMDRYFWQAWHVEAFARMPARDFARALRDHFSRDDEQTKSRNRNVQAIAFFHSLQARGVPVTITRH
jgi:hypothetical protein